MSKTHPGFERSQALKAKNMGIRRNPSQPQGPASAPPAPAAGPAKPSASKGVPSPTYMRPPTLPM